MGLLSLLRNNGVPEDFEEEVYSQYEELMQASKIGGKQRMVQKREFQSAVHDYFEVDYEDRDENFFMNDRCLDGKVLEPSRCEKLSESELYNCLADKFS